MKTGREKQRVDMCNKNCLRSKFFISETLFLFPCIFFVSSCFASSSPVHEKRCLKIVIINLKEKQ